MFENPISTLLIQEEVHNANGAGTDSSELHCNLILNLLFNGFCLAPQAIFESTRVD